jgi:hypothetical protein
VLDDTDLSADDLLASGVPSRVVEAVVVLTRRPVEPYDRYLGRRSRSASTAKHRRRATEKVQRLALLRRPGLLVREPVHAAGLAALKVLELLALPTGIVIGRISPHPADRPRERGPRS